MKDNYQKLYNSLLDSFQKGLGYAVSEIDQDVEEITIFTDFGQECLLFVAGNEFDDDNIIYSHEIGAQMSEFRIVAELAEEENLIDFDATIVDLLRDLVEGNTMLFQGVSVNVFGAADIETDIELLHKFDNETDTELILPDNETIGGKKLAFEILEEYNRYPLHKYEEKYLAQIYKQKDKFEDVSVKNQGETIGLYFQGKKDFMFITFTKSATMMDNQSTQHNQLFYQYLVKIAHWTTQTFDLPSNINPTLGVNRELFFFILHLLEKYYSDKTKAQDFFDFIKLNHFSSYRIAAIAGILLLTAESENSTNSKKKEGYGITISPMAVVLNKSGKIVGDFTMLPDLKNKIDMLKNTLK